MIYDTKLVMFTRQLQPKSLVNYQTSDHFDNEALAHDWGGANIRCVDRLGA